MMERFFSTHAFAIDHQYHVFGWKGRQGFCDFFL